MRPAGWYSASAWCGPRCSSFSQGSRPVLWHWRLVGADYWARELGKLGHTVLRFGYALFDHCPLRDLARPDNLLLADCLVDALRNLSAREPFCAPGIAAQRGNVARVSVGI